MSLINHPNLEAILLTEFKAERKKEKKSRKYGRNYLLFVIVKCQTFNYKDSELFRNKTASEEEYKTAFKEFNGLWREYFDLYTKVYMDLSAVTTDKEWQIMKKYTKGLF